MSVEDALATTLGNTVIRLAKDKLPPGVKRIARRATDRGQDIIRGGWFKYPRSIDVSLDGLAASFMTLSASHEANLANLGGEREFLEEFVSAIKPKDIIWDIGASTGTFSVFAALKTGKNGRVIALEPEPELAELFQQNLSLNNIKNITILEIAAWDKEGVLSLHTSGSSGKAPRTTRKGDLTQNPEKFRNSIEVRALPLNDLVKRGFAPAPDIIKIDVEGVENKVLEGMGNLHPRELFIEIHPTLLPHDQTPAMIRDKVISRGYTLTTTPWQRENELLCHFRLNTPT